MQVTILQWLKLFSDTLLSNSFTGHARAGLIPGLRPANERRPYFVTTSLIGWAHA